MPEDSPEIDKELIADKAKTEEKAKCEDQPVSYYKYYAGSRKIKKNLDPRSYKSFAGYHVDLQPIRTEGCACESDPAGSLVGRCCQGTIYSLFIDKKRMSLSSATVERKYKLETL